jgi:hypothetical protein
MGRYCFGEGGEREGGNRIGVANAASSDRELFPPDRFGRQDRFRRGARLQFWVRSFEARGRLAIGKSIPESRQKESALEGGENISSHLSDVFDTTSN